MLNLVVDGPSKTIQASGEGISVSDLDVGHDVHQFSKPTLVQGLASVVSGKHSTKGLAARRLEGTVRRGGATKSLS